MRTETAADAGKIGKMIVRRSVLYFMVGGMIFCERCLVTQISNLTRKAKKRTFRAGALQYGKHEGGERENCCGASEGVGGADGGRARVEGCGEDAVLVERAFGAVFEVLS